MKGEMFNGSLSIGWLFGFYPRMSYSTMASFYAQKSDFLGLERRFDDLRASMWRMSAEDRREAEWVLNTVENGDGLVNYSGPEEFKRFVQRVGDAHIHKIGYVTIARDLDVLRSGTKMTFAELANHAVRWVPRSRKYKAVTTCNKAILMWDVLSDKERQRVISIKVL